MVIKSCGAFVMDLLERLEAIQKQAITAGKDKRAAASEVALLMVKNVYRVDELMDIEGVQNSFIER